MYCFETKDVVRGSFVSAAQIISVYLFSLYVIYLLVSQSPFSMCMGILMHVHVHPNAGSVNLLGTFIQVKNQLICLQSYMARSV